MVGWRATLAWLALATAMGLGLRMSAPSDLYDNEQPKTVSYTADAVLHGRWVLPRDMFGDAPHKPPMYNWLGAPIQSLGFWGEAWLKAPAIGSGLATMALTGLGGAWLFGRGRRVDAGLAAEAAGGLKGPGGAAVFGMAAAGIWLSNHAGMKLIYLARPDMVMIAFLTGAWLLSTWLLLREPGAEPGVDKGVGPGGGGGGSSSRCWAQLGLWLCVAGAGLCKGPPALLAVVYVFLGARLLAGRWGAVGRTGMAWGLPLAACIVGAWLGAAYSIDRAAVVNELLGDQAVGKLHRRGLHRIVTEAYKPFTYFFSRFVPWSVLVVLALIHVPPRRWFAHPTGPMTLWVLVVIGFFLIPADRRPDYVAPAYPAAACLAGYWLLVVASKHGVRAGHAMMGVVAVTLGVGAYHLWLSEPARTGLGDHVKTFAAEVRAATGGEGLVFRETGYNPLQALLGYNQAGPPTPSELRAGRWLIRPIEPGDEPAATSEAIPGLGSASSDRLGLFRLEEGR